MICEGPEDRNPCNDEKLKKLPKGLASEKFTDLFNDIVCKLNCELFPDTSLLAINDVAEPGVFIIDLSANDENPEGTTLGPVVSLAGTSVIAGDTVTTADGTLTLGADGVTVTFVSAVGVTSAMFDYEMTDAEGDVSPATVSFTVNPPIAEPIDLGSVPRGTTLTGDISTVVVAGSDPTLTYSVDQSDPKSSSITINPDGTITVDTNNLEPETCIVQYTVTDENGLSSSSTITWEIIPTSVFANDDGEFVVTSGFTININPILNDENPEGTGPIEIITVDGQDITPGPVTTADGIIFQLEDDGSLFVNPGTAPAGSYDVTYRIVDPEGDEDEATFTVVVLPNTVVAVDDGPFNIDQGQSVIIDFLTNDSDPDGDTFSISDVDGQPMSAIGDTVTVTEGVFTLVTDPNGGANPLLQFVANLDAPVDTITYEYEITDSNGNTDTANVEINIEEATNLRLTTVDDSDLSNVTIDYTGSLRCDGSPATDTDCFKTDWYVEDADREYEQLISPSSEGVTETGRIIRGLRTLVANIEHCPSAGTISFDWSNSFITESAVQLLIEAEFSGTSSLSYNKATVDDLMKGVTTYGAAGQATYDQAGAPIVRGGSGPTPNGGTADLTVPGTTGVDYLGNLGFKRTIEYGDEIFREGAEHVFLGTLVEGPESSCTGLESEDSNEAYVRKGIKRIKAKNSVISTFAVDDLSTQDRLFVRIIEPQFGVNRYAPMDHFESSTLINSGNFWHNVDNDNPESFIDLGTGSGQQTWLANQNIFEDQPEGGDFIASHESTSNNGMFSSDRRWLSLPRVARASDGRLTDGRTGPRTMNIAAIDTRIVFLSSDNPDDTTDSARFEKVFHESEAILLNDNSSVSFQDTSGPTVVNNSFYPKTINIDQRIRLISKSAYVADENEILEAVAEAWIVETF